MARFSLSSNKNTSNGSFLSTSTVLPGCGTLCACLITGPCAGGTFTIPAFKPLIKDGLNIPSFFVCFGGGGGGGASGATCLCSTGAPGDGADGSVGGISCWNGICALGGCAGLRPCQTTYLCNGWAQWMCNYKLGPGYSGISCGWLNWTIGFVPEWGLCFAPVVNGQCCCLNTCAERCACCWNRTYLGPYYTNNITITCFFNQTCVCYPTCPTISEYSFSICPGSMTTCPGLSVMCIAPLSPGGSTQVSHACSGSCAQSYPQFSYVNGKGGYGGVGTGAVSGGGFGSTILYDSQGTCIGVAPYGIIFGGNGGYGALARASYIKSQLPSTVSYTLGAGGAGGNGWPSGGSCTCSCCCCFNCRMNCTSLWFFSFQPRVATCGASGCPGCLLACFYI